VDSSSGSPRQAPTTAAIPSPHSLAAILSPSALPDTPPTSHATLAIPNTLLLDSTRGDLSPAATPKRNHREAFAVDGPAEHQGSLPPGSPVQTVKGQHRDSITAAGADDGGATGMIGGLEDRDDRENRKPAQQKMVRSSIACARCRRSKVKCENTPGMPSDWYDQGDVC